MKAPLISIIMPVYNAAPFLEECLDSILHQSFIDWQLVAVDDYSTDESLTILRRYEDADTRIKCLPNTQKGIISALRNGYAHTQGSYITRMDADDIMPQDKLAHLLQLLQGKGRGHVATGAVKYFSDKPVGNGYIRYQSWLNKFCEASNHFDERYKECVIASPAWMVHKLDFEKCGGFEADTYPEDYDLVFRFYKQGLRVVSSRKIVHHWRDHSTRASRNDPHYLDNRFFELKIKYFLELDYQKGQKLSLLGAGRKGKKLAQLLLKEDISFGWFTNNSKKVGVDIYGVILKKHDKIPSDGKYIIVISNPVEQQVIIEILEKEKHKLGQDYFVFV